MRVNLPCLACVVAAGAIAFNGQPPMVWGWFLFVAVCL